MLQRGGFSDESSLKRGSVSQNQPLINGAPRLQAGELDGGIGMRYEVTYQVGGDERVEQVDAADAASAAATVQETFGRTEELFELIYVHLLDAVPSAVGADNQDDTRTDPA